MQPTKLKLGTPIDLDSKLKAYVIKNYDAESLTDEIKTFFSQLTQNQNVVSKMGAQEQSLSTLKQNKTILSSYVNQVALLMEKMTFGKESFSCKIEFSWRDTIKDKKWESYSIFFEYYNALFNLATVYYLLGIHIGNEAGESKDAIKESVDSYKKAYFLFNEIKEGAPKKMTANELPYDITPIYMDYCMQTCMIAGQLEIIDLCKVSKINGGDPTIQGKLCLGISNSYAQAYTLSNETPINKGGDDKFREFLKNRVSFYKATAFFKFKEGKMFQFEKDGKHYGEALFYQALYVQELLECQKTLSKCGKFVNIPEFEGKIEHEKGVGAEMDDKNQKIYRQPVPQTPDKNDPVYMVTPVMPDDLYIGANKEKLKDNPEVYIRALDMLIPKQVREMCERYKSRMNEIITQNLEKCENESTINNFISSFRLPPEIAAKDEKALSKGNIEFPMQLWNKIQEVQKLGGTMTLSTMMQNILTKTSKMKADLENTLNSFGNEEKDDAMNRQRFGPNNWIRKPSNMLNRNYIEPIRKFLGNLQQTRQFDEKENEEISQNAKYFEVLTLPRETLNQKIPGRTVIKKELNTDERNCRTNILELYKLSDQCMEIIKPIFQELNDDSIIVGYFVDVLAGKTTEQAIFEKNKDDYEKKFTELIALSQKVNEQKLKVSKSVEEIKKYLNQNNNQEISQEARDFFGQINNHADLYLNKYQKVKKGENYYNGIGQQIANLIKASNQWMIQRNNEKNVLIQTLQGNRNQFMSQSGFMDPSQNNITNMGVRTYGQPNGPGLGGYRGGY